MNVAKIFKTDTANGPGIRLSVFVSGCRNHCEGCFQPETWDFNFGDEYTEETENEIIEELRKPFYQGITFLGGDPMEPENQKGIINLVRKVRNLGNRDIWLYTGYSLDGSNGSLIPDTEFKDEILKSLDVMVDGRFVLCKKNLMLKFRGSSNQRLIDMNETRKSYPEICTIKE